MTWRSILRQLLLDLRYFLVDTADIISDVWLHLFTDGSPWHWLRTAFAAIVLCVALQIPYDFYTQSALSYWLLRGFLFWGALLLATAHGNGGRE